jgi:hypothetical protein
MTNNDPTVGPAPATITDLYQRFADRWKIIYESALAVWSAERRSPDGRQIRFICDPDPAELAVKLQTAEAGQ